MWQRNGGQLMQERDYYRPHDHREAAGFCQPFVDGPDNNPISTAEDVFLHLINNARRSVHITTPYLAIDEPMRQALCSAGDSGVDVRLLLPGIPDHKFAYLAAQSHYGELLVHHVKIYIYEPGLLHGKTVLSDGEAAFVGSVNMDYRSFQLHFECGTVLYGVPAIEGLAEDIQRITDRSRRVTYQEWKSRPWYRKLLSTLLRLFEMWMGETYSPDAEASGAVFLLAAVRDRGYLQIRQKSGIMELLQAHEDPQLGVIPRQATLKIHSVGGTDGAVGGELDGGPLHEGSGGHDNVAVVAGHGPRLRGHIAVHRCGGLNALAEDFA